MLLNFCQKNHYRKNTNQKRDSYLEAKFLAIKNLRKHQKQERENLYSLPKRSLDNFFLRIGNVKAVILINSEVCLLFFG